MNKPYLRKEYTNGKFAGWACGINGTSYHALFLTKREAVRYNAEKYRGAL